MNICKNTAAAYDSHESPAGVNGLLVLGIELRKLLSAPTRTHTHTPSPLSLIGQSSSVSIFPHLKWMACTWRAFKIDNKYIRKRMYIYPFEAHSYRCIETLKKKFATFLDSQTYLYLGVS